MPRRTPIVLTLALVAAAAGAAQAQPGVPIVGPVPGYRSAPRGHVHEGSMRLQITPRDAEVFVDGYLVGLVDDFDGLFQRLHVDAGEHELEVYRAGYKVARQKVFVGPDATLKVRYALVKLAPGEAPEPRPVARQVPPRRIVMGPGAGPRDPRAPEDDGPPLPGPRRDRPGDDRRHHERHDGERRHRGGAYGTLALQVRPDGAEVRIDGDVWELDEDGRLEVQVAPGRHRVEVHRPGSRPYVDEVDVRPGATTPLNVSLTPEDRR